MSKRNGFVLSGLCVAIFATVGGCHSLSPATNPASERAEPGTPGPHDAQPSPQESMARLERELAKGMAGAKEIPAEVSEPATPARPQGELSIRQAAGCLPDAAALDFAQAARFEGRGESPMSQDDADAAARKDLVKKLELTITGSDESIQQESSATGYTYSVSSSVTERVNLSLSGLEIAARAYDPCAKQHYAKARLDKAQAVRAWQADLQALASQRDELQRQLADGALQDQVIPRLLVLFRAMDVEETAAQIERRLAYLASDMPVGQASAGRAEQARQQLDGLLASLQIHKVAGDLQRAKPGRGLDQPLVARVVTLMSGGEQPVANVPLRFSFETGSGVVAAVAQTDGSGRAQSTVSRIDLNDKDITIVAGPAFDQFATDVPQSARQRLARWSASQTVRFSITAPQPCSGLTPLHDRLYKLACGLAQRVNTSYGAAVVVKEFIEHRTKRRLSLSDRIERAIADGLVLTGVLRVLDASSPEVKGVANTVVSGGYELAQDGNVVVEVKLFRLTPGAREIEATSEGVIPQGALLPDNLQALREVRPSDSVRPILTAPAPRQTFDDWVETFWHLHNPSPGFRTELRPERFQYRVGERASFRFRTEQDCYLTVASIGTSGAWTLLLPNKWRAESVLVRASQGWVALPGAADRYDFTVGAPIGVERIKAICTKQPLSLIEDLDLTDGLFQLSRKTEHRFRSLRVNAVPVKPEDWSEAHTQAETLEPSQTETRGATEMRTRGWPMRE